MRLGDPFEARSAALRHAYAASKDAQWTADDVAWDAADPRDGEPAQTDGRAARTDVAAAFHAWSNVLLGSAGRLTARLANADAQMLLAVHVHDYARHVECWRRYLERAGRAGQVPDAVTAALARLAGCAAPRREVVLLAAQYLPVLHSAYAAVAQAAACPLARALCERLADDLARHQEGLRRVCTHATPDEFEPGYSEATTRPDAVLGLGTVLAPELGADATAAFVAAATDAAHRAFRALDRVD